MIAIIDYGVGNLFSIKRSLEYIGAQAVITRESAVLEESDGIILPGVGAFGDAMDKLNATGLIPVLSRLRYEKPLLGICLGMQLLFSESEEYGVHAGLGFVQGSVKLLEPGEGLKVPHMGWNCLKKVGECEILDGVHDGEFCYFVHSFCAVGCESSLRAYAPYGVKVPAVVSSGKVYGCQFHPEKSGATGIKILSSFVKLTAGGNEK